MGDVESDNGGVDTGLVEGGGVINESSRVGYDGDEDATVVVD